MQVISAMHLGNTEELQFSSVDDLDIRAYAMLIDMCWRA